MDDKEAAAYFRSKTFATVVHHSFIDFDDIN